MRVFIYRLFLKWIKSEGLTEDSLKSAVREIEKGLFEANLGGGLFKKRVARKGQGKRGGYRTLLAYKKDDRIIFMYGFSKSEKENIGAKEEAIYKKLANYYLELTDSQLNKLINDRELFEVRL